MTANMVEDVIIKAVFRFDVAPVLAKIFSNICGSIEKFKTTIMCLATLNQNTAIINDTSTTKQSVALKKLCSQQGMSAL